MQFPIVTLFKLLQGHRQCRWAKEKMGSDKVFVGAPTQVPSATAAPAKPARFARRAQIASVRELTRDGRAMGHGHGNGAK